VVEEEKDDDDNGGNGSGETNPDTVSGPIEG
jgi:hypothetical protein